MSDITDLKAEVLLLRRENAKLRELATLNWTWVHTPCDACELQTECCEFSAEDSECNYRLKIYNLMHELGIDERGKDGMEA